jgi:hypothetical protein
MNVRLKRLAMEGLEPRSLPSGLAFGDFNNDGRLDYAELTDSRTVTVRLANPDGTYFVSATLKAPKNRPLQQLSAVEVLPDGNLDIVGQGTSKRGVVYYETWLGVGDGTFVDPPDWF